MSMSAAKQKLRPWLEDMISKGEINGLCWLNAEKTKFRIPWKHGGKQDWSPENSRIFMEWAKHTGKYREGVDEPNYPTWKTRLRCAFNKAPDIQEVKGESQLSCHEPYRVYTLTHAKRNRSSSLRLNDAKGPKLSRREEADGREEDVDSAYQSTGSVIPTVIEDYDIPSPAESLTVEECLSPDLQFLQENISEQLFELVQDIEQPFSETFPSDMETVEQTPMTRYLEELETANEQPLTSNWGQMFPLPESTISTNDHCIKLEIFYCGKQVYGNEFNIRSGLRLVPSESNATSVLPTHVLPADLLAGNLSTIDFPFCDRGMLDSLHLEQIVNQLLTKSLVDGLLLWTVDCGDIFACRLCQGAIFYASQTETDGKALKIPLSKSQQEFVKIFTCTSCLVTEQHENHQTTQPDDSSIYLCCGQEVNIDDIHSKAFVYIKIIPLTDQTNSRPVSEAEDRIFQINSIGSCSSISVQCGTMYTDE